MQYTVYGNYGLAYSMPYPADSQTVYCSCNCTAYCTVKYGTEHRTQDGTIQISGPHAAQHGVHHRTVQYTVYCVPYAVQCTVAAVEYSALYEYCTAKYCTVHSTVVEYSLIPSSDL